MLHLCQRHLNQPHSGCILNSQTRPVSITGYHKRPDCNDLSWVGCGSIWQTVAPTPGSCATLPNTENGETAKCKFLMPILSEMINDNALICCNAFPAKCWLSTGHECKWAGVLCDNNKLVQLIALIGIGVRRTFLAFLSLLINLQNIQLTCRALLGPFLSSVDQFIDLRQLVMTGNLLEDPIPNSIFALPLLVLGLAKNNF